VQPVLRAPPRVTVGAPGGTRPQEFGQWQTPVEAPPPLLRRRDLGPYSCAAALRGGRAGLIDRAVNVDSPSTAHTSTRRTFPGGTGDLSNYKNLLAEPPDHGIGAIAWRAEHEDPAARRFR
jgi:hypothetical protein